MANNSDFIKYEIDLDVATDFFVKKYSSEGYYMHFHRNIEIYGVIEGEVGVTIASDSRILKPGQMAIVNCTETHRYQNIKNSNSEVFFCYIGTAYISNFISLYKNKLFPRWLMDVEYNKLLFEQIKPYINYDGTVEELKKYGICNNLFADIIAHYGLMDGGYDLKSHALVEQVIQYINEHYAEDITLSVLAKEFCVEATTLSRKLYRSFGVDLRAFVNDIRAQKVIQMLEDPKMKGIPKKEIAQLCGFKNIETFYRVYKRNSNNSTKND